MLFDSLYIYTIFFSKKKGQGVLHLAIERSEKITLEAYNEKGENFSRGASGLLAQIFQHEMDHLNGVLFTDTAYDLEKIKVDIIK